MNGEEILNRHLGMIDAEIKQTFNGHDFPKPLYDIMQYHLGWLDEDLKQVDQYVGKRFRPTMCLLTYNALSGVYDKAIAAAASLELIHNFSLIHDDIEDLDPARRHKPTVWKVWGVPHAINIGDGMHVMANLAALRLIELNVTHSKIVDIMLILNRSVLKLCEGQYLDMSFEGKTDVTIDMYLEMVYRKTAALIEASTYIGAILATNDKKIAEHFKNFGRKIGIAFQIVDDIIGIWQQTENTGKPVASDIRNKKKTLPVLYAFENSTKENIKVLEETYKQDVLSDEDVDLILGVLDEVDAEGASQKIASKFKREALEELNKTGIQNESMDMLRTLTDFLVDRTY